MIDKSSKQISQICFLQQGESNTLEIKATNNKVEDKYIFYTHPNNQSFLTSRFIPLKFHIIKIQYSN